jgi:hypothetical protein
MENEKGLITQEQARELADKYLLHTGRIALRDNIFVDRGVKGWQVVAITTPIILGMDTEVTSFSIDKETGEVGASITMTASITEALQIINKRKDLDETKKEQVIAKVKEFKEASKKPIEKKKMNDLKKWFENNAPYLKSIIDFLTAILSKL